MFISDICIVLNNGIKISKLIFNKKLILNLLYIEFSYRVCLNKEG